MSGMTMREAAHVAMALGYRSYESSAGWQPLSRWALAPTGDPGAAVRWAYIEHERPALLLLDYRGGYVNRWALRKKGS